MNNLINNSKINVNNEQEIIDGGETKFEYVVFSQTSDSMHTTGKNKEKLIQYLASANIELWKIDNKGKIKLILGEIRPMGQYLVELKLILSFVDENNIKIKLPASYSYCCRNMDNVVVQNGELSISIGLNVKLTINRLDRKCTNELNFTIEK